MDAKRIRTLVEHGVAQVVSGEQADRVLDRLLGKNRDLTALERAHVAERLLGISIWRGRLDLLSDGDSSLRYALFLVDHEKWSIEAAALECGVDPMRLERCVQKPAPTDPVMSLVWAQSLPEWLAQRWRDQFGREGAESLAKATNERGPVCVRANARRVTRDALAERLLSAGVNSRPSRIARHGLVLEGRPNIFGLEPWRQGLFEVQDEASQRVADVVGARPGELIVDLCAGSGGKTLALDADMDGAGRIVAVDLNDMRLADLGVRTKRAGAANVEVRCGDATDELLTSDLDGRCDAVLVDAPCSELGVLRRSPDARWRLAANAPDLFVPLQRALLRRAARLVRPGGRVVYATCSVDRAENEGVVAAADPRLRCVSTEALRPDLHGCDGFFIARFEAAAA